VRQAVYTVNVLHGRNARSIRNQVTSRLAGLAHAMRVQTIGYIPMRTKFILILRPLIILGMFALSACFEEEEYAGGSKGGYAPVYGYAGPGYGYADPGYGYAYQGPWRAYGYESPWQEHEEEEHEHARHGHEDED
jgi:hypothetical protein